MIKMDPIKRQMMQEMIEFAAKDQQHQWEWIRINWIERTQKKNVANAGERMQ